MKPRRVVLLAFDGCQLLDVSGPASVFAAASEWPSARGYEVSLASSLGGPVRTSAGLTLASEPAGAINPADVDLLLVVGGSREGLHSLAGDEKTRDWAKSVSVMAERHGSVCTGAFVVAAWGFCDSRTVATHWRAAPALQRLHPRVRVDSSSLYVEDGALWTSAGVTAGIDMSVALVARDEGEACAAAVARRLVLPMRRSGNQAQHSRLLEAQSGLHGRYAKLIEWVVENLDRPLRMATIAGQAGQAERSFQREFRKATGLSPAAFIAKLRLERARDMIAAGSGVKEAARACGFAGPDRLTRSFTREFGASPSRLR